VNAVVNFRVPYNAGKFLRSCTTGGLSRRAQLYLVSLLFIHVKLRNVCALELY
jgi:hypothetical protein